ncbi:MAG: hypothetical protein JNL21_40440 [Myxococcales bacterium]|nr:hypothetical protein [Myxococcales bacterium]
MKQFCEQVFEDFIVGTAVVFTSPVFEERMGLSDRLAIQVVADQVTGTTPSLTVQVEHGSDGRNWAAKNGSAEINAATLSATITNNLTGVEPGTNPSHGRVRLRIALAGTNPQANVKIYVTGRDRVP